MNIGYVKINRQAKINYKNGLKIFFKSCILFIKDFFSNLFDIIKVDEYKKILYAYNFNNCSKKKLNKALKKLKIDYVLVENNIDIGYNKFDSKETFKYILPELYEFVKNLVNPKIDEVYISTNGYNPDNIKIIEELVKYTKVVNVITENRNFIILENELETNGIYINVLNNKRKCLKNASILINLDFTSLNEYNINKNLIVIDASQKMIVPQFFNGIIIKKCKMNTKKVLRIFSEFNEFEKDRLIEAEVLKLSDYDKIKKYINLNKIHIDEVYNKRKIDVSEFARLRKMQINLKQFNRP